MDRQHITDFRPTRDEIRAMSHFWSAALQNVKAAKNREERRKEKHGKGKSKKHTS